jgi:hypothetical protein
MFVFQSEINKGEMPRSSENSETGLKVNPDLTKNHQDATSDPDLPENTKKDSKSNPEPSENSETYSKSNPEPSENSETYSKSNPDRTKIDEDVADDFVRSLLHSYRKIRKSCRSKNEKDRRCKILDFDQDDLKSKFLQELSNLNT